MTDEDSAAGFRVVGGAGGTRAVIESLLAAAAQHDRMAEHLEEALSQVRRLLALVTATGPRSPATAGAATGQLRSLGFGPGGLADRSRAARAAAASLRTAAATYQDTDRRVASLTRVLTVGSGALADHGPLVLLGVFGGGLLGLVWGAVRGRPVPTAAVEGALPAVAAGMLNVLPGDLILDRDPVALAALLSWGASGMFGDPRELVVTPLVHSQSPARGPGPEPPPVPRGVADVLGLVAEVYPDPGPPGVVGVQRLDHADGSRSWVIAIPGTQSAGLGGPVPMDMRTNLALAGGVPDDMTEVVYQAMVQAGVEAGEPVLLAGHSQGGMVAMRLAADARVVREFDVVAVVTAGSPVGRFPLPDGVQALHLEHVQDYVPALDATPNPDHPARTTVIRDLSESNRTEDRAAAADPMAAHGIDVYGHTARRLQGAGHPSVREFERALAAVLGDGSARAVTRRYLGVRKLSASAPPAR